MATSYLWANLLLAGLLLSGFCARSSVAFPPKHVAPQQPQFTQGLEAPVQLNTVRVRCHPDVLEILIDADMFGVGAPVDSSELHLGVQRSDFCRATATSKDVYTIVVGLGQCGTKHWMTEDSLVYTNLLIYSPAVSMDGVIRMEEAVIPIECHYERKYSLSSSSLMPTWIPFTSTQAAVEILEFDLKILTSDWLYKRSSNVFYIGDPISIEASVRVGHHMGLRVFLSSCVATLHPDINSDPRYIFIKDGCLVDSQLPGSRSGFLPRTQDDKLHLIIDAFKFHNEDRGELYITCHLTAVPVNDAEAPNKACTFVNGRWRSADGNDYLCGQCPSQNEVYNKPTSPSKFGPRGFGKPVEPEPAWRSGLKTSNVWEKDAQVGPMLVLPTMQKSGPLPVEELPPVLNKISRPALYGSQWRSGINRVDLEKGLVPEPSVPDQIRDHIAASEEEEVTLDLEDEDIESEAAPPPLEKLIPGVLPKLRPIAEWNDTAFDDDASPSVPLTIDVTTLANATAPDSDLDNNDLDSELSHTNDPKR